MEYSYFDRFSSKIKRINVPVPSYYEDTNTDSRSFYKVFRNVYNYIVSAIDLRPKENLIGRDIIIERLKTWLLKDRHRGASYLVTGYRGMGKTSFVNRVIEQLVGDVDFIQNVFAYSLYFIIAFWPLLFFLFIKKGSGTLWDDNYEINTDTILLFLVPICLTIIWLMIARWPIIREKLKKLFFNIHTLYYAIIKEHRWISLGKISPMEWNRINNILYGGDRRESSYSRLCIKLSLGQEILHEKDILSVLTYQLNNRWRKYCQYSVITELEKTFFGAVCSFIVQICYLQYINNDLSFTLPNNIANILVGFKNHFGINGDTFFNVKVLLPVILCFIIVSFFSLVFSWSRRSVRRKLNLLKKSVDASREHKKSFGFQGKYKESSIFNEDTNTYKYDVADTRVIESQLIDILDFISSSYLAPTLFFVFDELDKIEDVDHESTQEMPEYSNERNFPGGGASRKRKHTVMRLLANMKFFTTTAKAKFIFIAGREMYDGYLADFTDREAAASSLFDGVIYVESFCKNEKSDRNVTYNAETYIARQLIPRAYIKERIIKELIECKLKGSIYDNIDIDLKMYYEFLIMQYAHCAAQVDNEEQKRYFDDARKCIDRIIVLLYHFSVYLFQISSGSPKKMRINFTSYVRLIKKPKDFQLPNNGLKDSPLEGVDLDIFISKKCKYLLTFTEKEQRVIGFIHYISFPVNQIMSNADRFSDKLLVSASFLINHIYKFHKGGFSWRNLEQIPELLEVYKIPEFRSFINSILNYLLQTHMIMIHGGLYDYKFRKQISEEISIASKTSEEVSAIYNFTLDDSQSVKRHYLSLLEHIDHYHKNNGTRNNSSMAAYHHILGDLYMSDEEYNSALSQYKIALKLLYDDDNFTKLNEYDPNLQDPKLKNPKLILSIIRNHLKIGLAYEKRRSNLSAYAVYDEIIALLFHYRHFDEKKFGLKFVVKQEKGWPKHETDIFLEDKSENEKDGTLEIEPIIDNKDQANESHDFSYKTRGSRIITDFSNLVTPEKHEVLQRLSLIGDTKFVFQAMLAKLFVIEKIELGGITRENLDVIEGEFQYLHLATNVHEKFIIASDFYRRLGDIMYYKNGLIGFNFWHDENVEKSKDITERIVDSLYYYGFDIKSELHDYCRKQSCFQYYSNLLDSSRLLDIDNMYLIQKGDNFKIDEVRLNNLKEQKSITIDESRIYTFWKDDFIKSKIKKIPLNDVESCNDKRNRYWEKNRTLPCYACRFYHHSLEILMKNWLGVDFRKDERKAIGVLRQIALRGSAKSSRQIFNLQFAEVLDTLGNTMLSCSSAKDAIGDDFFICFMHDTKLLFDLFDNNDKLGDSTDDTLSKFLLLQKIEIYQNSSHMESALLYYLEASYLFLVSTERKKAVGSLHKIIKIILNYLRVTGRYSEDNDQESELYIQSRALIGEMICEIKFYLIRQCLKLLYNHYNFINVMEIQHLKWIFYTQMYESISLTQLSLFPDVEEIMLNYYEIIKLCVVLELNHYSVINSRISAIRQKKIDYNVNEYITQWQTIEYRNSIFNSKLTVMYNNMSMGKLRNESTVTGRMLSLRFKSKMNEYIMALAFPDFEFKVKRYDKECYFPFLNYYGKYDYLSKKEPQLKWKDYYKNIDLIDPDVYPSINFRRLFLLEFLVKDSMFCLTEILETVTPYTTTTLFTDAFMAGIYYSLYKWSNLFEELFLFYKVFDELTIKGVSPIRMEDRQTNSFFIEYDLLFQKDSYDTKYEYYKEYISSTLNVKELETIAKIFRKIWNCNSISSRFYNSVFTKIKKPNMHYTMKNYAREMALNSFRRAKEVNREGKAYKEMINNMYFLDDDLKNDTIQFDLAVERFRINSDEIDNQLNRIKYAIKPSIYDIEKFGKNSENELPLSDRFDDLQMNVNNDNINI